MLRLRRRALPYDGESAVLSPSNRKKQRPPCQVAIFIVLPHSLPFRSLPSPFDTNLRTVLWCLHPERAQDGYWCGYTERHPQDLVEFERVVSLVRRVGNTHPALPSVEKQLLLDRILTDHYARRRFAAPPRRRNRTALFAAASLLVAGVVAALFWSADFTGSGLLSAEAYENITLVTREGCREVYDDIARISLTPKGEILIDGKENEGAETDRRTPRQEVRVHTSELVVPKGKRAHLQLSDGTRVWNN